MSYHFILVQLFGLCQNLAQQRDISILSGLHDIHPSVFTGNITGKPLNMPIPRGFAKVNNFRLTMSDNKLICLCVIADETNNFRSSVCSYKISV